MKYLARTMVMLGVLALVAPAAAQAEDESVAAIEQANDAAFDARLAMVEAFAEGTLENGKFLWKDDTTAVDRLVLSLSDQMIYAYDGDHLVGVSTVSTGREGRETPAGTFKIIAKHRYYRSKKYDNAPMPYMQQITSYGVARHAGPMTGYPASHGCIRLPPQFAANLFAATHIGIPVLITP